MISKTYLIESIPKDEKQTGEELYNDTIFRYNLLYNSEIKTFFKKVETKNELLLELESILTEAQGFDEIIIHIEAHGNETEMGLSGGEIITWDELTENLIPINIKIKNKLHLNLAACFSMHSGLSIDLKKIAPYKSYISTLGKIAPSDIVNDNTSLYENIMKFKVMYTSFVNFNNNNQQTKFRIKDVETVINSHLIPRINQFVQSDDLAMVKSFFEPYLNIKIDLQELYKTEKKVEYILNIFTNRFYP